MVLAVNRIHRIDALKGLKRMPDELVDCVVTSPPYWFLRDYGIAPTKWKDGTTCTLGLESNFMMYITHMCEIFDEIKRVLKKTGTVWVNLGDTYHNATKWTNKKTAPQTISRKNNRDFKTGRREEQGLQEKCLCQIPSRFAIEMARGGWTLRNDIVWHKPNHMPASVKDRLACSWEHLFFFVKSRKYFFDLDAIRVPHKIPEGGRHSIPKAVYRRSLTIARHRMPSGSGPQTKHPVGKNPGNYQGSLMEPRASVEGVDSPLIRLKNKGQRHRRQIERSAVLTKKQKRNARDALDRVLIEFTAGRLVDFRMFILGEQRPTHAGSHYKSAREQELRKHGFYFLLFNPRGKNPGDYWTFPSETRSLGAIIGKRGAVKVPGGKGWVGHPPGGEARILRERDPRWLTPSGKNPGDCWDVSTKPALGAHFAVFPEKLCERPILAGCPPLICKACGAPKRLVRTHEANPAAFNIRVRDVKRAKFKHTDRRASRTEVKVYDEGQYYSERKQQVVAEGCKCKAGFQPGLVLDPFMGSGTTAVVARKFGRNFIGFDLNGEYVSMARRRLAKTIEPPKKASGGDSPCESSQ